jgi:hypothetical protein
MYLEISWKTDVNSFWSQAYNSTGCLLEHYDTEIILDSDTSSDIDNDTDSNNGIETDVSFPR